MRFGAGGDRIVLGGSAPTEETWLIDAATGRPSGVPIVVTFPVVGRSFSPDGKTLLLLGDRQAELWDTASGQRRGDPMAHEAAINCTAISPDGALLATASDLKVRLWETATGRPIGEPLQHPSPVRDLAFNHSGKALLTHCSHAKISGPRLVVRDAMARLWDARTGRPLTESLPHEAPTVEARLALDSGPQGIGGDPSDRWRQVVRSVRTLARSFSPDGKFFLTYQEATAHLHDAETGRPIGAAITHSSPITAAAIRPNGKAVLLVGRDGAARLWYTSTGAPAGETLKPPGGIRQVSFTPDGKMAVVIGPKTLLVDADTGRAIVDDRLRLRF
jgi:WD40 repeat protein